MIVSLRGTNGSGKSHLVRRIMALYKSRCEIQYPEDSKKRPMGYVCVPHDPSKKHLFVPGHYQIANGGIDTLPSLDRAYDLARVHSMELGMHVLMEGKNLSDGVSRLLVMRDIGCEMVAVFIDEPLDICIKAVRDRGHSISEKTIASIHAKCQRQFERLMKEEGIQCVRGRREQAYEVVRSLLDLT